VPSADIPNDPERIWRLPSAPADLDGLRIEDGVRVLDLDGFLAATHTDGLVVLHRGAIVCELYAGGMTRRAPHIFMSVSKSVLGLLFGILAEAGALDPEQPATRFVPELETTAYRGATLRHLLDMRAGIMFDEDYLASSGPIIQYRKAQNWNPLAPGEAPMDLRRFYQSLSAADGPHGGRFHYISPNTDLLGWVIERATGERYADLLSRLIWQRMGAEESAYITVDQLGAPRAAGGFCGTTRDLARLGQLMVQDGSLDGRPVVPAAWIADILSAGDAEAWANGDFAPYFPGRVMAYRSKWYVLREGQPILLCLGVFGQNLFIDRANQVVIAKFSSQPLPLDTARITLSLRGFEAIRRRLAGA
jgi:CubicO group peptidase (beta-lactamase class C family)